MDMEELSAIESSASGDLSVIESSTSDEQIRQKPPEIAVKENRLVNWIRCTAFFVLIAATAVVAFFVFHYGRSSELHEFEEAFQNQAAKIIHHVERSAHERQAVIRSFTESVTAHGLAKNKLDWPMMTLPNFEERAFTLAEVSGLRSVTLHPVVHSQDREAWEAYARRNQDWLGLVNTTQPPPVTSTVSNGQDLVAPTKGISRKPPNFDREEELFESLLNFTSGGEEVVNVEKRIPGRIYRLDSLAQDGKGARPERGPGPFLPGWQMAPILPIPSLVNLNALSLESRQKEMLSCMESKAQILSKVQDYNKTLEGLYRGALLAINTNRFNGQLNEWGPVSDLYIPVFETFDQGNSTVVAILATTVFWLDYFANILPEGMNGLIVVLDNTCSQSYTFEIGGFSPTFLGPGDLHESEFDDMVEQTSFGSFFGNFSDNLDGNCYFRVSAYPSTVMQNTFVSDDPIYFALIMVGIFALTAAVFFVYDRLNQRRHHVENKSAVETNAVVSNLFPDEVRDRMVGMYTQDSEGDKMTQKQAFMRDSGSDINGTADIHALFHSNVPIADLYPHTTVLFTDIAGFTKYSSSRNPTQIFQLLEALYGSFDRLARKHNVFKIETIGDCYVAVTGLPKPQKLHAEIMCRFASACLVEISRIMPVLVDRLGEDTAELSMRFGLHSGPVTAGVLRGQKARFQLFGDTVNTAARMESNGQRGRIHVSQSTADLLIAGGKQSWVTKREDLVSAKGKGLMQTYWVDTGHSGTVSTTLSSFNESRTAFMTIDDQNPQNNTDSHLELGPRVDATGCQEPFIPFTGAAC